MQQAKKFKVVTLGCRTNQYESAAYADQLLKMGYSEAKQGESAELCIVNTCTVTESADSASRHQIRNLKREHPEAKLVVTGCLAERLPEEIGKMEEVFLVVGNQKKESLLTSLFPEEEIPEFKIESFPAHTRAFVKVQDGCNSFCTYCIIPYVRGRSRSRKVEEIVQEVEQLVANGYKEVVLTGINIGDFDGGEKNRATLADLVRAVDAVSGLERLRVSSIDPDEVDANLMDAILNGKKSCPSMHVVLQSGSNVILKRMNRKYTRQIFLETVERLYKACPEFTITTDVIVGFPGETEEDFEETLDVIQKVGFTKVHMFPYSERKRTRAALFPNKVPQEIIAKRKQKVLHLAEQVAFQKRSAYVGKKMQVLIEKEERPGCFFGHTANFLPVLVTAEKLKSNDLITVECLDNSAEGLVACRLK